MHAQCGLSQAIDKARQDGNRRRLLAREAVPPAGVYHVEETSECSVENWN